jgi:ABC-type cobalamin transport system ATPase subunit
VSGYLSLKLLDADHNAIDWLLAAICQDGLGILNPAHDEKTKTRRPQA